MPHPPQAWAHLTMPCPTASVQKPTIYPLRSCCDEPKAVGCLVKGYFPEPVTVTWDTNSQNVTVFEFPTVNFNSSFLVTTSQVLVSGSSLKQFTCRVTHTPTLFNETKLINVCSSSVSRLTVKLLHSSCNQNKFQPTIQLHCLISHYTPGDLEVTWLRDGQQIGNKFTESNALKQDGRLASTQRDLNITQSDWASESTFTCQVSSQGQTVKAHTRKCTDEDEPRGVRAYLIPPSPVDLYIGPKPKLTCLVVDLENKKGVTVTWTRESGRPVKPDDWTAKTHENTTVSIKSTLPVLAQDWIEGERYTCSVNHPDLPKPIVRYISKATGTRVSPKVYVFQLPEKGLESQDMFFLTCLAQNFFPKDISVLWLRNGKDVTKNQYSTTPPTKINSSPPSFFIVSRLQVTQDDWTRGHQFTCRVVHEALPYPRFTDETVSKSSGK
uniref:Immunoglobulin heavy constant epsilon n=1 Tax=Chinchilla lanigera TaxID=34839 RepID=A0A8C2UZ70_CHILA